MGARRFADNPRRPRWPELWYWTRGWWWACWGWGRPDPIGWPCVQDWARGSGHQNEIAFQASRGSKRPSTWSTIPQVQAHVLQGAKALLGNTPTACSLPTGWERPHPSVGLCVVSQPCARCTHHAWTEYDRGAGYFSHSPGLFHGR